MSGGKDRAAKSLLLVAALVVVFGMLLIVFLVLKEAFPAITKVGLGVFSTKWNPQQGQYGMMIFIVGTLLSTLGGLAIGVPLALGIALFVTEVAPARVASVASRAVEVLAGVPSIIIGWLGLTLLVPFLARTTHTAGSGLFAAWLVLAVMVIPTVSAISIDALRSVPDAYTQGSIGLGATRWQTMRHLTLPAARNGIVIACILGAARAIGETVAVAMVIGPATSFPSSIFSPTHTLSTKILMEMGESSGVQRSSLFVMAVILLLISMMTIGSIRIFGRRAAA